uniref:Serine/arginine repetitive matrix protein 1-like n=1 Tax=Crassostrea virginica TaxID=6565 RepID=A0A8B8EL36_CRAVI|nr:serine/arginine repetitive matrix protein 1-like [Crassostrea virginica]
MVIQREEPVLVRRRVLYIGSSVPIETTEGLEAIQQPLRDRYPVGDNAQIQGIDAWVNVLPSGLRMQYVRDPSTIIEFPIFSLTLCAAVRQVRSVNGATGEMTSKFVSLTSQQAGGSNAKNPAIFTAITRRTKGRKVLECHGFLCASDQDAFELVKATKFVDANYKKGGTVSNRSSFVAQPPTQIPQPQSGRFEKIVNGGNTNGNVPNGGLQKTDLAAAGFNNVHLQTGEAVESVKDAAPEFYDAVPSQGYFYSGSNTEVKKYNIEKIGDKAYSDIGPSRTPRPLPPRQQHPTISARGGPMPPPMVMAGPPRGMGPPRRPMMLPPPGRPIMVGPRPRFFSPPPPMMRRPMYGPPPPPGAMMYGPPPPPIYVRRPKQRQRSGSPSSSTSSRSDRDGTSPKRMANGNSDSGSDISDYRPKTPPRDYELNLEEKKRERLSRRDIHERGRRRSRSPDERRPQRMMYPGYPPTPYIHPVYGPIVPTIYGYGRSRSVPPHMSYPTDAKPDKKKGKKDKKKKRNGAPPPETGFGGYTSEVPFGAYPPPPMYDSQLRRPRDFRREENQFLNEKSFSKSMKEQHRSSKGKQTEEYYPTAYDLNQAVNDPNQQLDTDLIY